MAARYRERSPCCAPSTVPLAISARSDCTSARGSCERDVEAATHEANAIAHAIEKPKECAAELSSRFINDRHLPDKAIDVIDEAGAAQRILPKSKQKKLIGKHEIEDIIAKIARIPSQHVSSDDRSALK